MTIMNDGMPSDVPMMSEGAAVITDPAATTGKGGIIARHPRHARRLSYYSHMRSNDAGVSAGSYRMQRPVWVDLRRVYSPDGQAKPPRLGEQTINLTQECPGVLHAWYRATTGEWYGVVSFAVMFSNLNPSTGLPLVDQLVPADALRPRTYGAARRK